MRGKCPQKTVRTWKWRIKRAGIEGIRLAILYPFFRPFSGMMLVIWAPTCLFHLPAGSLSELRINTSRPHSASLVETQPRVATTVLGGVAPASHVTAR